MILLPLLMAMAGWLPDATADTADFLSSSSSPSASMLLGTAVSEVDRPTTASTLSTSVSDTLSSASGFPDDYALEIAPFWMLPRRSLRLDDYLAGGPRILADNLTVSLATSENDADALETAAGLRTALIWGDRSSLQGNIDACVTGLKAATRSKAEWLDDYLAAHPNEDLAKALEAAEDAWEKASEELQDDADEQQGACMLLLEKRRGFALDISLAGSLAFPDQNVALGGLGRAGIWLSPAWLQEKWSLVGNVGWMVDDLMVDSPDPYGKVAAKLVLAGSRVAIAPEGVYRYHYQNADQPHQGCAALGLNLKLGSNLWVSTTLGAEFPLDASNSLVNQVSVTWDSGTAREIAPATAPMSDSGA